MKIKGKRQDFDDMLTCLTVGKTFLDAVVQAVKDENGGAVISSQQDDENTMSRYVRYTNIKVIEPGTIKFQADNLLQTVNRMTGDDKETLVLYTEELEGDEYIVIKGKYFTRRLPSLHIEDEEEERLGKKPETNEDGVPQLTNPDTGEPIPVSNSIRLGGVDFKKITNATSLSNIEARWIFKIQDNNLKVKVGNLFEDKHDIEVTPERPVVRAPHNVEIMFTCGLEALSKVFKEDVVIYLENNLPGIFHEKTNEYNFWAVLHHVPSSERLAPEPTEQPEPEPGEEEDIFEEETVEEDFF